MNLVLSMNILVLKKKIIFVNIKKSYRIVITQTGLFYYFIKKKLLILVSLFTCVLKKHSIITKDLKYYYTLK